MNFQRGQVKREVREAMRFTRPRPIWVTLFFLIVVSLVDGVISALVGILSGGGALASPDFLDAIFSGSAVTMSPGSVIYMAVILLAGALVSNLWQSSMNVGYTDYCMDMVRGRGPGIDKLFAMIRMAWPIIVTEFLVGLFSALWIVLFYAAAIVLVGVVAALVSVAPAIATLGIPLILAAVAGSAAGVLWAVLRYSMVNFLIADRGISGLAAIRESKRLMKGNLLKYLGLELSFLPWYLPALIAAGILAALIAAGILAAGMTALMAGNDSPDMGQAAYGFVVAMALASLLLLVQGVLNLYVRPYMAGVEARFYFWLTGTDVGAPRPPYLPPMPPLNDPQSGTYTSWSDEFRSGGSGTYSSAGDPSAPPPELPPRPARSQAEQPHEPPAEDPWDRSGDPPAGPDGPET